jgi:hypothetical protein
MDVADRIIERAYGDEVPTEWTAVYERVAKARSALASPTQDEPLGVDLGELKRLAEAAEADNENPNFFEAVRSLQSFNEAANPAVILKLIAEIERRVRK